MTPATSTPAAATPTRYDGLTITLHWLTALLVVTLFALAMIWDAFSHQTRLALHSLHISLGIVLAVVLVIRLAWRATGGRRLPLAVEGLQGLAAKAMHHLLYLLLVAQVALGLAWRWAQAESFEFFGLFPMRLATERRGSLSHTFGNLHDVIGWTIIVLAGMHAAVALYHHYGIKDGVLKRMLGGQAQR
ncbi:cytochrome b [Dyella sp. A6]|uniref:cytochrome b n=1 Tax=Dyella aluminiiresistens TaxID=3069105 RepID=UPI002E75F355|nr:cytochrome b [Dyella sp. A6]